MWDEKSVWRKNKAAVMLARFVLPGYTVLMMTAGSMLSKRPVLRFTEVSFSPKVSSMFCRVFNQFNTFIAFVTTQLRRAVPGGNYQKIYGETNFNSPKSQKLRYLQERFQHASR